MDRFSHLALLLVLLIVGCSPTTSSVPAPERRTLQVFAAASLTDAFTELGENFEAAHPGVTISFNFAGSQALRTQIEEGAPADVFASANKTEMDHLITGKFVAQAASRIFLNNRLIVILPANNPAALETLNDLAKPGIKLVLAAEEVPVGRYTRQALALMNDQFGSNFMDHVLTNVVSNEDNVRQVLTKVRLGEVDAGIVYTSDAAAALELETIEIPAELNVIADYQIAPLIRSAETNLAVELIEYILSTEGQAVLEKWGFTSAE